MLTCFYPHLYNFNKDSDFHMSSELIGTLSKNNSLNNFGLGSLVDTQ